MWKSPRSSAFPKCRVAVGEEQVPQCVAFRTARIPPPFGPQHPRWRLGRLSVKRVGEVGPADRFIGSGRPRVWQRSADGGWRSVWPGHPSHAQLRVIVCNIRSAAICLYLVADLSQWCFDLLAPPCRLRAVRAPHSSQDDPHRRVSQRCDGFESGMVCFSVRNSLVAGQAEKKAGGAFVGIRVAGERSRHRM